MRSQWRGLPLNNVDRDQHRSNVGNNTAVSQQDVQFVAPRHFPLCSDSPSHIFLFTRLKCPIVPYKLKDRSMTTILEAIVAINCIILGWSHKIFSTISTTNKYKLHTYYIYIFASIYIRQNKCGQPTKPILSQSQTQRQTTVTSTS